MLKGKKILLGVSGSIAAYKAAILVRLLVKEGAEVKVIMTNAATSFITPLTLSTLSGNPVFVKYTHDESSGVWNNHVELGMWADVMLIAPASANTLAKMANGICDNLLMATYLSAKCPVYFAPAMDLDMYRHPSTLKNLRTLSEYGNLLIPVEHGELASGLVGEGRLAEPEVIVERLEKHFSEGSELSGKKVLISAGPTYEHIDPVRFIGNHSTGKMGFAVAHEAANRGAEVVLVCGPNHLSVHHSGITRVDVTSAEEMYKACQSRFKEADVAIMSAAVADYTPQTKADQKMKKTADALKIELKPTKDILKSLGEQKKGNQFLVGFALETNNELENAKGKLKRKNLDMIVLNSLQDKGAGFGHNTNKITILDSHNNIEDFELKDKSEVASDIWNKIIAGLKTK